MTARRERDEGSVALEFTLVAPALLLLVALLVGYARVGEASSTLAAGVRDGARAATSARSAAQAQQAATDVVRGAVGSGGCADSLDVAPLAEFRAGRPVTVTASCRVALSDLGLPGLPGSVTVHASFSSPLDPNRELR